MGWLSEIERAKIERQQKLKQETKARDDIRAQRDKELLEKMVTCETLAGSVIEIWQRLGTTKILQDLQRVVFKDSHLGPFAVVFRITPKKNESEPQLVKLGTTSRLLGVSEAPSPSAPPPLDYLCYRTEQGWVDKDQYDPVENILKTEGETKTIAEVLFKCLRYSYDTADVKFSHIGRELFESYLVNPDYPPNHPYRNWKGCRELFSLTMSSQEISCEIPVKENLSVPISNVQTPQMLENFVGKCLAEKIKAGRLRL